MVATQPKVVLLAAPTASPQRSEPDRNLLFLEDVLTFDLKNGEGRFGASFPFVNSGEKEIQVSEILTSCGCMTPRIQIYTPDSPERPVFQGLAAAPLSIPPDAFGELEIQLRDPVYKPGEEFYVTIITRDGAKVLVLQAPGK